MLLYAELYVGLKVFLVWSSHGQERFNTNQLLETIKRLKITTIESLSISYRYKNVLDRKNGELPPECTPNIDRLDAKHVWQPKVKGLI